MINNIIKVSIIIPVYNIESFLPRCLDSIVGQTMREIEIITVNDGSTDRSLDILHSYAKKDKRIRVFSQENKGLSVSRNLGICIAQGDYILFVDGDDFIDSESCERLYREAIDNNLDIVAAGYCEVRNNTVSYGKKRRGIKNCDGKIFFTENMKHHTMSVCAPYALYKRELIINNTLMFEPGLLHEDELWTPQVYFCAKKVSYLDFKFYFHCIRENSITTQKDQTTNALARIYISKKLYKILENMDIEGKKYVLDHLCMLFLDGIQLGQIVTEERIFVLLTAHSLRNRIKALIYVISPRVYLSTAKTYKKIRGIKK